MKNCKKLKFLEFYRNSKPLDADDFLPELGLSLSHDLVELIIESNWRFTNYSLLIFLKNSQHINSYKLFLSFTTISMMNFMKSLKYIGFE